MATQPQFGTNPQIYKAIIAAANTALTGAGPLTAIASGGVPSNPNAAASALGTRIDRITFTAQTSTSAGMLRLFIDGVLYKTILTNAVTIGATAQPDTHVLANLGLVLPPGSTLCANNYNSSETWGVVVEGELF